MKKSIKLWELLSSKYLLKKPWLTLREDACRIDGDRVIEPYYILESPDFVHTVAVNAKKEFLIVWQYRHGCRSVIAEFPGGCVDADESDVQKAAARELLEETGYEASEWDCLLTAYPNPARQQNRVHMYLARELYQIAEPELDEYEDLVSEWITLDALKALIAEGAFANAYHVSAAYMAAERLGL